jgi:hypothetical protein
LIQDQTATRNAGSKNCASRFDCCHQRLVAVETQNMSPQQIGGYVRIHAEALSHCVPDAARRNQWRSWKPMVATHEKQK